LPTSTAAVLDAFVASGIDGLRLVAAPLVPEVRLHLADDAVVLRARLEAQVGPAMSPLWANAWAGGQALARYVIDHPEMVAGKRVLDVAAGSGLVAIAAARAGAAAVTANDIDPYAPPSR
jgi:predicted nicotinamide N-methyase